MKPDYQKNLCVIGAGYWGKNLIRVFNDLGVLKTVVEPSLEKREHLKNKYPDVEFVESVEVVFEDPSITKCAIVTPTASHYSLAKRALLHHKDVFVEKAMCSTAKEALDLAEIAHKQKCILMVGHLLHYHPGIKKLKSLLEEGLIGKPFFMQFDRLNFGSKGPEKSALWAFAPHDVSLLLSFADFKEIQSVQSYDTKSFSESYSDSHFTQICFAKGLTAQINVNWLSAQPARKLTLVGSKGSLIFDDLLDLNHKLLFTQHCVEMNGSEVLFEIQGKKYFSLAKEEPLLNECQHFLDSCIKRTTPQTCGVEGYRVIRLLEAIDESARKHRRLDLQGLFDSLDEEQQERQESTCLFKL